MKKPPPRPRKNFQKMGELKNEVHLSRLARARGAIGYIGFFVALTQTLVPRIYACSRILTVTSYISLSVFDSDMCSCRAGRSFPRTARRRERELFNRYKLSILASERGLKG